MAFGLMVAVALSSAIVMLQSLASEAALELAMRNLGDKGDVVLDQFGIREDRAYSAFQKTANERTQQTLGPLLRSGTRYAISTEFMPDSLNGKPVNATFGGPRLQLAFYEELDQHVERVAGQLRPDVKDGDAWWITVSEAGAKQLNLQAGDPNAPPRQCRR